MNFIMKMYKKSVEESVVRYDELQDDHEIYWIICKVNTQELMGGGSLLAGGSGGTSDGMGVRGGRGGGCPSLFSPPWLVKGTH